MVVYLTFTICVVILDRLTVSIALLAHSYTVASLMQMTGMPVGGDVLYVTVLSMVLEARLEIAAALTAAPAGMLARTSPEEVIPLTATSNTAGPPVTIAVNGPVVLPAKEMSEPSK